MIVSGVERTMWSDVEEDAKDWTFCRRRSDAVAVVVVDDV